MKKIEKDIKEKKVKNTVKLKKEKKTKKEKIETLELEEKKPHKKISKASKIIIIVITSLFIIGTGSGLFLLYGPWGNFRNWLITTAMTTMNHQYLATWFYSNQTIQTVCFRCESSY